MRKSYFRIINLLVLSLMLVLSIANPVLADGGPHEEVNKVDGYRVKLTFVDGDIQLGNNKLKIEIKDVIDQAVGDAKVTVVAELYRETSQSGSKDMGADISTNPQQDMSAQSPIRTVQTEMKAGQKVGEYEGVMNIGETGTWMIQVGFLILSRKRVAEFPTVLYGKPDSWVIVGSFVVVNIGIIAAASICRRKRVNAPELKETK